MSDWTASSALQTRRPIDIPEYQADEPSFDADTLAHHGIKGQKWGVRRFQNTDGSLTAAGKQRYGTGNQMGKIGKTLSTKKEARDVKAAYANVKRTYDVDGNSRKLDDLFKKRADCDKIMRDAYDKFKEDILTNEYDSIRWKGIKSLTDDEELQELVQMEYEDSGHKFLDPSVISRAFYAYYVPTVPELKQANNDFGKYNDQIREEAHSLAKDEYTKKGSQAMLNWASTSGTPMTERFIGDEHNIDLLSYLYRETAEKRVKH